MPLMRALCLTSTLLLFLPIGASGEHPANRLAKEKSPYLLQHAHNPVNWYPWGEEAFALAKKKDLPIFLSIGYATCHWCHVMERESFEDSGVAAYLNQHFIPIKVDREERPDVDRIYMAYQTAIYGHGGWPLNVWLTPDREPFASGTYFPPKSSDRRPSFQQVLEQITTIWSQQNTKLKAQAKSTTERLQEALALSVPANTDAAIPGAEARDRAQEILRQRHDLTYGGFGDSPKFPTPGQLEFLLQRAAAQELDMETRSEALAMVRRTLEAMADGGIHDHLGGGFHRYSVDRYWRVPHFEKMLYDQAQLARCYVDLHLLTGESRWAEVARDIFSYIDRQMTSPEGAFYSAEDADSLPAGQTEGEKREGAFFLWSAAEIAEVLGKQDGALFAKAYGVESSGNSPPESDPHAEFTGLNILYRKHSDAEVAEALSLPPGEVSVRLGKAREKLFTRRQPRPRPILDDKILTAWNGLMISSYCRAYQVLGDVVYLERAQKAADFLLRELRPESGSLLRSYREGASNISGFAEDYAFAIAALLDLYESDFDPVHLQAAIELQEGMLEKLHDAEGGGFYDAQEDRADLIVRMKSFDDGAEPAANSVATSNLLRLAIMLGREDFAEAAHGIAQVVSETIEKAPHAALYLLNALRLSKEDTSQIIIAGARGANDTRALTQLVYARADNRRVLVLADGDKSQALAAKNNEAIDQMKRLEGAATLYLCRDFSCRRPTTDPSQAAALIKEALGSSLSD